MKLYLLLLFGLIFSAASAQDDGTALLPSGIGPAYRVHPSNVTQSEVFIVRSPADHNILFAGCNTISFVPFFISEGVYVTTNGGGSWQGSDSCKGNPVGYHGGDPGITIDRNGRFILTRLGRSPFVGLYSHYSLDNGQTWSLQQVISTDDLERAALATDAAAGAFSGRTYAVWTKLAQPFPLMFSSTSDGAQSWTAARQVNNPSTRCAGGDVAVGSDGTVYTCWAGVTEISPFKEILVGFASSANGGLTWNVHEQAFPVNGITGLLASKNNIRVNGLPNMAVDTNNGPRKGWLYIVTGQKDLAPAGSDPDIIMYRSADGGATWSPGIRVNQDALNNGKIQYFANVYVDQYSAVNVIYYDDRNTTSDSAGVFLSRSTDGGNTWKEFEIGGHHFKPVPIGGLGQGYQGDVIDITSTDTKLWPVWMDNSSGIYQVWTTPIDFSFVNAVESQQPAEGTSLLSQNVPNPFSTVTTLTYRVPENARVSLRVFDLLGNCISEPVSGFRTAGTYRISLGADEILPGHADKGGIFFLRLDAGGRSETRKMVFMK